MDFIEKIQELSQRIPKQIDHIQTEEATKSALVMPFIQALGYDVFNPLEVVPELTADVGTKKGEKVDYAIKKDNAVTMLIECKWCGQNLDECHASQLYRYFSVTDARFGILTNGIYYKFFSDIDQPNKMDSKPFFEFDLLSFDEDKVVELKKFSKSAFDLDNILTTASELKYTGTIKKIFAEELANPSPDFVRFFASQAYSGRLTAAVMEQFTKIVKQALSQAIREKVNDRLKSALAVDLDEQEPAKESAQRSANRAAQEAAGEEVQTTQEEIDGFNIVRAIGRELVDVSRITMRDRKSYCGILLDDNGRKPICRLHFNTQQKYIGLISQKEEERIPIDKVDDIFQHGDQIKATIRGYLE
ncbi:MAG: type I restriction endonuclease [Syntrophorhabdus sp.]